jgi:hypothetical protein
LKTCFDFERFGRFSVPRAYRAESRTLSVRPIHSLFEEKINMTGKSVRSSSAAIGLLLLLTLLMASMPLQAQDKSPIGAWFGIARPCTAPPFGLPLVGGAPVSDPAPDPEICGLAVDSSTPNAFPLLQVTMIPTLLADGTVMADDFGELLDHHTTAQGKWEYAGKVRLDGREVDKYEATFVWFSGPLSAFGDPDNPAFIGSIRPRFVTYFDKKNPDEMRGYIQPYLYRYTEPSDAPFPGTGIGAVIFDGEGKFPNPSPTDPLPNSCDTSPTAVPQCLGTLHFYIHRIPAH